MSDSTLLDNMTRSRGRAKRDLIAQAAMVPKLMDESAERIRHHLLALKNKEVNEWEMCEAILEETSTLLGQLGLTALMAKLVAFQLTDMEARRVMLDAARGLGVRQDA